MIIYLILRELSIRRQLKIGVRVTNSLYQFAFVGITWNNDGTIASAFLPTAFPIQFQSRFGCAFRWTVALVAIVGKDRPDFSFEEVGLLFGQGWRLRLSGSTDRQAKHYRYE
jgi:hypothetical protein